MLSIYSLLHQTTAKEMYVLGVHFYSFTKIQKGTNIVLGTLFQQSMGSGGGPTHSAAYHRKGSTGTGPWHICGNILHALLQLYLITG